jgi:hypothetical protein
MAILQKLDELLPAVFGLNTPAINECRKVVKREFRNHLRAKPIILPDDPDWHL